MKNSLLRLVLIAAILAVVIAVLGGAAYALSGPSDAEVSASLTLADALNANDAGFEKVTEPRKFTFPDDHGPHPEYALEWWYYTGNLDTAEGRHFGYELTFFRIGLTTADAQRTSEWASKQMYTAHFALTDVEGNDFYSFERYSRDALGLAGAIGAPFRVWLEDWSVEAIGESALPMRLYASDVGVEINLTLGSRKGIVLQGEDGFSRKGTGAGEASYYYSHDTNANGRDDNAERQSAYGKWYELA